MTPNPPNLPNYDMLSNFGEDIQGLARDGSRRQELEAALTIFDQFHVVDSMSESHLAKIRETCDMKVDGAANKQGIILWLATNSASVPLMKQLLQLGLRPDMISGYRQMAASHWASFHGLAGVAEILGLCRPNLLAAETEFRATPEELANKYADEKQADSSEKARYQLTARVWENFSVNGFPLIAQLTAEEKYWAVQNLCRHRVVPEHEKTAAWGGRTAIEWARHHRKMDLALEMEYLLQVSPTKIQGNDVQQKFDTGLQYAQQVSQLVSMALSVTSKAEEVRELKQEMSLLKLALAEEKIERLKLQQEVDFFKRQVGELQRSMQGKNSSPDELMELHMERDSVLVAEMRNAVEELGKLPSAIQSSIVDVISTSKKAQG